jgi:hypothetical protein
MKKCVCCEKNADLSVFVYTEPGKSRHYYLSPDMAFERKDAKNLITGSRLPGGIIRFYICSKCRSFGKSQNLKPKEIRHRLRMKQHAVLTRGPLSVDPAMRERDEVLRRTCTEW